MSAKNPSNSDLLKEIRAMHATLEHFDGRLDQLETWRISTEAATRAIERYKHDKEYESENRSKMDVLKALGPLIIAATALLYALITYLQRVK